MVRVRMGALRPRGPLICVALAVCSTLCVGAAAAMPEAVTIAVTTTTPGIVADGQCSLAEAISNANAARAVSADCAAQQARTFLWNSIIANNAGGDCAQQGGSVTSAGHNLASDGSCSLDAALGDLPRADARLGPLQDNGGPTPTHALLPGSPAIDRGNPDGCRRDDTAALLTVDQRGALRPQGAACDIGAYEAGAVRAMPQRVLLPRGRRSRLHARDEATEHTEVTEGAYT